MEGENMSQPQSIAPSAKRPDKTRKPLKMLVLIIGAAVLCVLFIMVVSFWKSFMGIKGSGNGPKPIISSKVEIASVGDNAFGVLTGLSTVSSSGDSNKVAANASLSSAPAGQGGGVSEGTAVDAIYPYEPTYYVYTYKGEDLKQEAGRMNVLKRVPGKINFPASTVSDALSFNLFDLGKLGESKTSSLSFVEDKEFGYRTDIDLMGGVVSVYKNWEKWPNVYAACSGSDCKGPQALSVNDIPQDDAILGATRAFLDGYRVDLSSYGTPEINKYFNRLYASPAGATVEGVYVPDEMAVVYPLLVEGKGVYESYGEINGLNVSYDIRNQRVSSMYNLATHNYQSSAYDAETDIAKILEKAKNVDGFMPLKDDSQANFKTIELELGTPVLAYEVMWKYEDNKSSEYLVPCFAFPVKENPDTQYYGRKRVIVPLIKEFLSETDYPVRAMAGATDAGAGVSSSSAPVAAIAKDVR